MTPIFTRMSEPKRLKDYEPVAKICSSFIFELFFPDEDPETEKNLAYFIARAETEKNLAYFIARAFSQSELPTEYACSALILLQHMNKHNPEFTLSSYHEARRLFLSSYIVASKFLTEDRYRLDFWVEVGQRKFDVEELKANERDFLRDVKWDVRIDDATLAIFQLLVERRKQINVTQGQVGRTCRSGSITSHSSAEFSDSSGSSCLSSSATTTPPITTPATPEDFAISDSVIAAGLSSLQQSEYNSKIIDECIEQQQQSEYKLKSIDECIEQQQQKLDALLAADTSCRSTSPGPKHGKRHMVTEWLRQQFHVVR